MFFLHTALSLLASARSLRSSPPRWLAKSAGARGPYLLPINACQMGWNSPPLRGRTVKRCGRRKMEIGDVVHLKSGGPEMTVEIITEATAGMVIRCVWFDGQ